MNVYKLQTVRASALCFLLAAGSAATGSAHAQNASADLHTDPATGIVYRKILRNVQRPVVDQRIERQEQTVYRPETVVETKPEFRTSYIPVTSMKWRPQVEGRWNLFRQPTVSYQQIPETHWEARSEVVNRTTTQTRWVPEKRTVEVPHNVVRYESQQHVDYEPIARVMPHPSTGSSIDSSVAARLQPLESGTPIASLNQTQGHTASEPPMRNSNQSGMATNVLIPAGHLGSPLTPGVSGVGIATAPPTSTWR
ncbi:hypothetical protein FYK55_18875 [Roseiconus nitratireducens]|uniref:Secreted protein n=1 Tax=Roseiconus nitratireducens TaxID=2605748 RepID=A0A5M6D5D1_9BACT|nr:hypothetical protein [Roseiconus nitratireducens]KAA5540969.1 hypothetical protein FYK55_18875 [Roseiconus nitratireducens]